MILDYNLETPEERNDLVKQILAETPEINNTYLEKLADYLIFCMEKQEKKNKKILTDNRLITVNRRETSFEGLATQFENGEDGVYNLVRENEKGTIFYPRNVITQKDLDEIEPLRQLHDAILRWESFLRKAEGRDAFIIKKALIEMRRDQYIIKNDYRKPVNPQQLTYTKHYLKYDDTTHEFDKDGYPIPEGISLLNPQICACVLSNYSKLKQESWNNFEGDTWFFMKHFDELSVKALHNYPIYERVMEYKIDGLQAKEIQEKLEEEFNCKYSAEYISTLWRKKIPLMIASAAEDEFLDNYYLEVEKGHYKKCSHCGQIKLAHNKYFSKNKTSNDGFYSICKECRSKIIKQRKEEKKNG